MTAEIAIAQRRVNTQAKINKVVRQSTPKTVKGKIHHSSKTVAVAVSQRREKTQFKINKAARQSTDNTVEAEMDRSSKGSRTRKDADKTTNALKTSRSKKPRWP